MAPWTVCSTLWAQQSVRTKIGIVTLGFSEASDWSAHGNSLGLGFLKGASGYNEFSAGNDAFNRGENLYGSLYYISGSAKVLSSVFGAAEIKGAQTAGIKSIPVEIVRAADIYPASPLGKKRWSQAFDKKLGSRDNMANGGRVPCGGVKQKPILTGLED